MLELLRSLACDDSRSMAGWIEQAVINAGKAKVATPTLKPAEVVRELRHKVADIIHPPTGDDYDPDSERTVEPDPDYLASQRQPRRR